MSATQRVQELIGADDIQRRVGELAAQIDRDYQGEAVLLVGVLKGSFIFLADLVRRLTVAHTIDFLRVASYGAATETSGVVAIRLDLESAIADKNVLIVEDIVDTGLTLDYITRHLAAGMPRSIRVCTLLDKPSRRRVELKPDFVGFRIEDRFVVGYGLDYDERYRNLSAICTLDFTTS